MPLYKYLGGILTRDGLLAKSENCCCGCGCPNVPLLLTATISGAIAETLVIQGNIEGEFNHNGSSTDLDDGCDNEFGEPSVAGISLQLDCVPGEDSNPDRVRVRLIGEGALCPFDFTVDASIVSCDPVHLQASGTLDSSFPGCPAACQGQTITIEITE